MSAALSIHRLAETVASIPIDDWQFWATTILAISALGAILRPFVPKREASGRSCPGCPNGDAAKDASRPKHVDLTIGGKRVR